MYMANLQVNGLTNEFDANSSNIRLFGSDRGTDGGYYVRVKNDETKSNVLSFHTVVGTLNDKEVSSIYSTTPLELNKWMHVGFAYDAYIEACNPTDLDTNNRYM